MTALVADLAVLAGASVLLLSGFSKIAQPRDIAATLALLWNRLRGQPHANAWPPLGRMLGAGEIVLAAAMVLDRSWATGAALVLFALALSAAGAIGVLSSEGLPCACFGKSGRELGYPHILQLPLWVAAAFSVASEPSMLNGSSRLAHSMAMLAFAAVVSTSVQVVKMWRAVYPIARRRRLLTVERALSVSPGTTEGSWR